MLWLLLRGCRSAGACTPALSSGRLPPRILNVAVLSWSCCQIDQVGVIYYDRDIIKKVDKAGCCKPCGTHNSPCPTCFDMCVPRCEVVPSCLRPLLTRLLPPPLASLQQLR